MKAKAAKKPRIAKTYRLQEEAIKTISKLAEKSNKADCEIIEETFIKTKAK